MSRRGSFSNSALWWLTTFIAVSSISHQDSENVCTKDISALSLENTKDVDWELDKVQINCVDDSVWIGTRPAATCTGGKWRQNGLCRKFRWILPKKNTVFQFPRPLDYQDKFAVCISLTPSADTMFAVKLADKNDKTFIIIRVIFNTRINGVQRRSQILIHTERAGKVLTGNKVASRFPFAVGKMTSLKITLESETKLGVHVSLKKVLSFESKIRLEHLQKLSVSNEPTIQSVDVLCRVCEMHYAPDSFPNGQITWKRNAWPPEGAVKCNEGNITWRGKSRPRATCAADNWVVNGECVARFIHNAVPGKVYTLPRLANAGHEISIEGTLSDKTSFSVGLTRKRDQPVIYRFDHTRKLVTGTSNNRRAANKDTFYSAYPLVVGRPFVIKLAIINTVQVALQVDSEEPMFYNATIVLTGTKGVTGFVFKGDVKVKLIDLQHDLDTKNRIVLKPGSKKDPDFDFNRKDDIDFGVKLPRTGYACDVNKVPVMPNARVTGRTDGSVMLADVACNKNFVWSKKGPAVGFCSKLTGWLFQGMCKRAVWTPRSLTGGMRQFKLPINLTPGRKIAMAGIIRKNTSHIKFQTGDKDSYRIIISIERQAVSVRGDTKDSVKLSPSIRIKLNSTVFLELQIVGDNTVDIFINGAKQGIALQTKRPVGSIVALDTNMQVKSLNLISDLQKTRLCTQELAPSLYIGNITWTSANKGLTGKVTCPTDYECYPRDKCSATCSETTGWDIEVACIRVAWAPVSTAEKIQPSGKDFSLPSAMTLGQEICLSGNVEETRSHVFSFKEGVNSFFHFGLNLDQKKVVANTHVKGAWGKQVDFDLPWTVKPNGNIFVKFRVLGDRQLELVINGLHSFIYKSDYRIQDVNYFATSLKILAIDFVCNRHKTNFCTKDLAPTLNDGVLVLKKVGDKSEGAATCNTGLTLTKLTGTQTHCSLTAGWVLSEKCVALLPKESSVKPSSEGYRLPLRMTSGNEICWSANIGIGTKLDLQFKDEKNVLFRFQGVLGDEKLTSSTLVDDEVNNKFDHPAPWRVPRNGTVFMKVTVVHATALELIVNGIYSHVYQSPFQVRDIKYFKTSLTILEIDLLCHQHKINFCRTALAPSLARGTVDWRVNGRRLQGSNPRCSNGYTLSNLSETPSYCDHKSGWLLSVQCTKQRANLTWRGVPSSYAVPLLVTPGQEICLSAKVGKERVISFIFQDYGDVMFYFEIRKNDQIFLTSNYIRGVWQNEVQYPIQRTVPPDGIMFVRFKAVNDDWLEIDLNGVYQQRQRTSGFRVQDIEYLKTSTTVLEFDPVCHLRTVNFCREELVPSLSNGSFLVRNVDGALDVTPTCNSGYVVHALKKVRSQCSASKGWTVGDECLPRTPSNWEVKQPRFGLKLTRAMDVGHKICLVVDTKAYKDGGYRIKMRTGKGNIEYTFTYVSKEARWMSQIKREVKVPQTVPCPLQTLRKAEKLLISLVAVGLNKMEMIPDGNTEGCYSTSSTPVKDLQYIESDFPIRSIDMKCDQKQTDWYTCSKYSSPIIGDGLIKWTPLENGLEANIQCKPNFLWSGVGSAIARCDKWTGWTSDGLCIQRKWSAFDSSEASDGLELRTMRPGRSICFTIPHKTQKPVITLSSRADVVIRHELRFWLVLQSRKVHQNKIGVRANLTMKSPTSLTVSHILKDVVGSCPQLSMGGLKDTIMLPASETCKTISDAAFLNASFKLLDVDIACELDSALEVLAVSDLYPKQPSPCKMQVNKNNTTSRLHLLLCVVSLLPVCTVK